MPTIFENVEANNIKAVRIQLKECKLKYDDYRAELKKSDIISMFFETFFRGLPEPHQLVNCIDGQGIPLIAYAKSAEMVEFLINQGADVNLKINTLLLFANYDDPKKIFNIVLDKIVDRHLREIANIDQTSDLIKKLLEHKAEFNSEHLSKPLLILAEANRMDISEQLLNIGAKIDSYSMSSVIQSNITIPNRSCIDLLVEYGAELRQRDFDVHSRNRYIKKTNSNLTYLHSQLQINPNFAHLNSNLISDEMRNLPENCPELKELILKKSEELVDIGMKNLEERIGPKIRQLEFKKDLSNLSQVATADGLYDQMNTPRAELDKDGKEIDRILPGLPRNMIDEIKKHMAPSTKLLTNSQIRDVIDFDNSKKSKGNNRGEYLNNLSKFSKSKGGSNSQKL